MSCRRCPVFQFLVALGLLGANEAPALASARNAQPPQILTSKPFRLVIGQSEICFKVGDPADLRRLEQALQSKLGALDSPSDPPAREPKDKRARRGLREIERLTHELLQCSDPNEQRELEIELLEAAAAVNNLKRMPIPEAVDFFQTPWFFLERVSRPVGRGQSPAANLQGDNRLDPSRLDPLPSPFWRHPAHLATADLFHGFGRTNLLLESSPLCAYAGPKESFGRNPGFEVDLDGTRLKLKFAEVSSEPFAARIFAALGYYTDPTDYVPTVRVRYSRQLLQEFNSRKPLQTHFTFLRWIPLFTLQLQEHYDPFAYIRCAVLTNGRRWSGTELKRQLFCNPAGACPEAQAANFRPEIEAGIAWLETEPANVQLKEGKSIGPWDFGDLDHSWRRELRGAALLAAWVGWFDTRFDNTRLRLVKRNGRTRLSGYFSDLGGVLGETTGLLYARGELPNAFPWTFTRPPLFQGPHRLARPLRLSGYKPIASTPAFAAMNIDDARWMARWIGALSEEQIKQALVASGFDSAQVRLYLEKLVSRRDQMVRDLGLANEIPLLRPSGNNRHFSYDPASEGAIRIDVGGKSCQSRIGNDRIVNGTLVRTGTDSLSPQ